MEAGATFSIILYSSSLPASDLNLSTISSSNEVTASAIVSLSSAVPGPLVQAASHHKLFLVLLARQPLHHQLFLALLARQPLHHLQPQSWVNGHLRLHHWPSQAANWLPSCPVSSSFCFSVTRTLLESLDAHFFLK